eukprot:g5465.t1
MIFLFLFLNESVNIKGLSNSSLLLFPLSEVEDQLMLLLRLMHLSRHKRQVLPSTAPVFQLKHGRCRGALVLLEGSSVLRQTFAMEANSRTRRRGKDQQAACSKCNRAEEHGWQGTY